MKDNGSEAPFTPSERYVVGLQAQQAAGREVAVLVVVNDRGALEQELVDVGLQRQNVPGKEKGVKKKPWRV